MSRKQALQKLLQCVELGDLTRVSGDDVYNGFASHRQAFFVGTFNGSLDTAKALHEAVLPGWIANITQLHNRQWIAQVVTPQGEEWPKWTSFPSWDCADTNPARAWLTAIIKALIAECRE